MALGVYGVQFIEVAPRGDPPASQLFEAGGGRSGIGKQGRFMAEKRPLLAVGVT